jgi:hypothetical protein
MTTSLRASRVKKKYQKNKKKKNKPMKIIAYKPFGTRNF